MNYSTKLLRIQVNHDSPFFNLVANTLTLTEFLNLADKFEVSQNTITYSLNNPEGTSKHLLCLYSVVLKKSIKTLYTKFRVGTKYLKPHSMEKIHQAQQRIISNLETKTKENGK